MFFFRLPFDWILMLPLWSDASKPFQQDRSWKPRFFLWGVKSSPAHPKWNKNEVTHGDLYSSCLLRTFSYYSWWPSICLYIFIDTYFCMVIPNAEDVPHVLLVFFFNWVETANYSSLFDCQEEKGSKHVKAARRFAVYFLRLHPAVQSGECLFAGIDLIVASLQIPFSKVA